MSNKFYAKITTLIVAFAMVLVSLAMPVMAEEAVDSQYDYSEAVAALTAFGILDGEADNAAASVTRGAFVTVISRLFGIELGENYPSASKYSDVYPEDKIFAPVSIATDLGLLSGYGDGTFRPDDIITKAQAVKIIVTLLGYEPVAATYGGYPSGYLTVASMNNVLKGVNMDGSEECTWGEVAQIFYNAVEVDLMKNAKYPVAEYHVIEGSNILNSWLHIFKTEGIVQANDITSLTEAAGVSEGRVKIAGYTYDEGDTVVSSLLGYRVKAFYKENDSARNEVVFITEYPLCKLETLSSADAESATVDRITYFNEKSGKIDKYDIATANIIYNNKWVSRGDANINDYLNPEEGNFKFLDADGNGVIDVVFIEEYSVFFVNSVNADSFTITDKYSPARLVLDPSNTELKYEVVKEGKVVDFADIRANNVVSVIESPAGADGKKFIQLIIGTERFSGEVTELSDRTIYIDGEEFEIFDSVRTEVAKLALTDKCLFYLTYDNKIAGLGQVVTAGKQYGYLVAADCIKKSGIGTDTIATLRLFVANEGDFAEYDTASRLSINGNTLDGSGNRYNGRSLVDILNAGGSFQHQLVKFQLDQDDNVKAIDFAIDNSQTGIGYDLDNFSLDYEWEVPKKSGSYYGWERNNSSCYRFYKETNGGMFDSRYLSGSAVVLRIPELPLLENGHTAGLSGVLTDGGNLIEVAKLSNDYTYRHIEVYDSDDANNASIIILRTPEGASRPVTSGTHFIVDKVVNSVNEDGSQAAKIYGYYGTAYVGYSLAEVFARDYGNTVTNLRRGDVIRIARNTKGEISNVIKVFTLAENPAASEFKLTSAGYNNMQEDFTFNSYFRLNSENLTSHIRISAVKGTNLYGYYDNVRAVIPASATVPTIVYDEKTDKLSVGSLSDIIPEDPTQSVVLRITWGNANQVYIINRENEFHPVWAGTAYN